MSQRYTVRRAINKDIKAINYLIHDTGIKWFGNKRPKNDVSLIFQKYQTHRLVVELNDSKPTKLLAYAEFRNYPAVGPLPSDSWLEWLKNKFCITLNISWMNTMFLNFCIYRSDEPQVLLDLLQHLFYVENRVWYLITVKTPVFSEALHYVESFDDLAKYAKVFYPRVFSITSNPNTQSVYIMDRFTLLPSITYRKALAEDNDDIIEMHENEFPEMRAERGDFYIAEELMRTDKNAKNTVLIVAELENKRKELHTAGFIWLDSNVDIRFYVRNYEMETFGNLVKYDCTKPMSFERINVESVEPKPEAYLFTADAMDDLDAATIIGGVQQNDSGVSVASLSKMRVSSIQGKIMDVGSQDKFYMREDLYLKFAYIFEKLVMTSYYVNEQSKLITLNYNVPNKKTKEDGVQAASNVFALKFICVHKEFQLERLFNCLTAMYSAFPDRDYCIMTIPKSAKSLRSHVEALKYFMPVAQRPSEVSNLSEIYITHRSTFFGEISLYEFEKDDVDTIIQLTRGSSENKDKTPDSSFSYSSKVHAFLNFENEVGVISDILYDVLRNEGSEFYVFTIRCGDSNRSASENTAVGFVILRCFLHHHEMHYHYHLPQDDSYLNHRRAEIISLRLHPLFNNSCEIIFRNLAAKTNYYDFYFICARGKYIFSNDLKSMMLPIEPKRMKNINFAARAPKSNSCETPSGPRGLQAHDYYNDDLIIFRHKLNPSKWFGNTNRLVIVGFTSVAKAFLRQLVFQWNSKDHANSDTFTCLPRIQVVVIAAPGIVEADYDCMFQCPYCDSPCNCYLSFKNSSCFVRDVVVRMDLRLWVHFVTGHVNYIDREKKFVKINKSCEIYYDTLLLMNYVHHCLRNEQNLHHSGLLPSNFVEVNNRLDKFILYYKLRVLLENQKRNYLILIYGGSLRTFECIAFLMTHGVAADRIVFIMPHQKIGTQEEQKLKNPYYDQNLQYVLEDLLNDCGVKTHRDLNFSHWIQHGTDNFVLEVVFTRFRKKENLKFDCDIFISYDEGHMDTNTKNWLTSSGIWLKGSKILVDKNFRTNDPDIYAAGSFIRMEDNINHQYQYTSERETASKLMQILYMQHADTNIDYKYTQPSFFKAQLPLGYFIVKVTMPRRYLASTVIGCSSCALTTYHEQTFCRIGLSAKMIVDEIVIVTKQEGDFDHLEHLCGKHESMLNNLKARYEDGSLKCLMQFLQEPWTELLTHEDFTDFQAENHKMLTPMIRTLQINKDCSENEFRTVNQHLLEQSLLEFVRKNRHGFHHEFALPEDYWGSNGD